jgi:hypothetical protein
VDRAGNINYTEEYMFAVRKNLTIFSPVTDIYLSLGSYVIVPVYVSNRQDIDEVINLTLPDRVNGGYDYCEFSDTDEGILSGDKRELSIAVPALETKTVYVMVYTSAQGAEETLIVNADSTLPGHDEISDSIEIRIKVDFPAEFSGMSWPAVMLLLMVSSLAYIRFGTTKTG